MRKVKGISYKVHPDFFNNYLEPNRKIFEKRFNSPISQVKLTELLVHKMNYDIGKIKMNANLMLPKRRRKFRF